jgi:hypothetical protein
VLVQFATKTTKVLCGGQDEEKEGFTNKVKFMQTLSDTEVFFY